MAKLKKMNPDIVARIDEALLKKMNSLVTEKSDSIDGKNVLAQILKQMDSANEEKLLDKISSSDPLLSEELRERLFTIDDIVNGINTGEVIKQYEDDKPLPSCLVLGLSR